MYVEPKVRTAEENLILLAYLKRKQLYQFERLKLDHTFAYISP